MEELGFEQLYNNYVNKVFRFVLKLSGNYHIAEDITQETFVKAWSSLESFRGECKLDVYLCQIAKHLFFDYIKKRSYEVISEPAFKEAETQYAKDIAEIIVTKENMRQLNKAILQINEPYRSIIIDRLFLELSYKEMALKYSKTENWVRVNYYRAKQKVIETVCKEDV